MKHEQFRIGEEFWCGERRWRCTDVGSRVIVAICLEPRESDRWPSGSEAPPFGVRESSFDEYSIQGCSLRPDGDDDEDMGIERSEEYWRKKWFGKKYLFRVVGSDRVADDPMALAERFSIEVRTTGWAAAILRARTRRSKTGRRDVVVDVALALPAEDR
jgi:hypothetical protein